MSSFRLASMLAAALAVCLCLSPLTVAGQSDPTTGCFDPNGDSSYGDSLSDAGYSLLYGLESYYSTDYEVLCSWRGAYYYGPNGTVSLWGPWHGNPNDTHCDVHTSQFFPNIEWPSTGYGTWGSRTNKYNGRRVLTFFKLGNQCDSKLICAGLCSFANPNYEAQMAALQKDPTFEERSFTGPVSAPPAVYTNINSTQLTIQVVDPSGISPTAPVSVVTSFQLCYGAVDQPCPLQSSSTGAAPEPVKSIPVSTGGPTVEAP